MRSLLFFCIIFCSCSTLKRTLTYSALGGAVVGGSLGAALSPSKNDRKANAVVFGFVGAAGAAIVGYSLYKDDPRNYKLKNMLMPPSDTASNVELNLGPLKIDAKLTQNEVYEVPLKELPEKLKGKVNKQYLIQYESKERYIKNGAKTYFVPNFSVYEYTYGDMPDGVGGEK